ncbi:MAG: PASTA domain-containing protein [Candidatus Cryptobacteroides sp.]
MEIKRIFWNGAVKNILAAVVLVLVLVFAANSLLKVLTRHNQEITVPDFTNMSVEKARREAEFNGMRVEVTDSVYVRRMARGAVFRQNPPAGSNVKKGRRILLTINAVNPKSVTMPNLIGYSLRQAKAEILSRGLVLGKLIYVDDIATNNVLKQLHANREIDPGETIESESVIDIVVGLNDSDNQTFIPDVTGSRYMSAKDAIHEHSLNLKRAVFDKTVETYSDSLDAVVYKMAPSPSEMPCDMGSEVTIYLTLDKRKVPVKEPIISE